MSSPDTTNAFREVLDAIVREMRPYTPSFELHPPATEAEIDDLRRQAVRSLGAELPEAYLDLLRLADGVQFDGVIVYASHRAPDADPHAAPPSLVEANLSLREADVFGDYVVFGGADDLLLALHRPTGEYQALDPFGLDADEAFDSFNALVLWAYGKRLPELQSAVGGVA